MFVIYLDSLDDRYNFSDDLLSLTIDSLERNDTGLYSIIAINPAGISTNSLSLHVGSNNYIFNNNNK